MYKDHFGKIGLLDYATIKACLAFIHGCNIEHKITTGIEWLM